MKQKVEGKERVAAIDQSSTTNQKIFEAAVQLFGKKGIEGVSVREIADHAQVNPSLISYHFGGKDGLIRAIIENIGKSDQELIERILKKPQDFAEFKLRLRLFIEELVEVHQARPELSLIVAYFDEKANHENQDLFDNVYLKIFNRIISFFDAARELGFANKKINSIHMTHMLLGGIADIYRMRRCHKFYLNLDYNDPKVRRTLIDSIYELCISGFAVESSEEESTKQ